MVYFRHYYIYYILAVFLFLMGSAIESVSWAGEERATSVLTLYGNNYALVKDRRYYSLGKGENHILLGDISSDTIAETIFIMPSSDFTIKRYSVVLTEERSWKDLLKIVSPVKRFITFASSEHDTGRGIEIFPTSGGISFSLEGQKVVLNLEPEELLSKQMLDIVLVSDEEKEVALDISYITRNISWRSDYSGILNEDQKSIKVQGMILAQNRTAVDFKAQAAYLMTGNVPLTVNQPPMPRLLKGGDAVMASASFESSRMPSSHEIGDSYIYKMPEGLFLRRGEQGYFPLFEQQTFDVEKRYHTDHRLYLRRGLMADGIESKVRRQIKLTNTTDMLFPKGVFRMFEFDSTGDLQFTGSWPTKDIPSQGDLTLDIGDLYSVKAKHYRKAEEQFGKGRYAITYETVIKSYLRYAIDVDFQIFAPGNIQVTKSNFSLNEQKENTRISWTLPLPAQEEIILRWQADIDIPSERGR